MTKTGALALAYAFSVVVALLAAAAALGLAHLAEWAFAAGNAVPWFIIFLAAWGRARRTTREVLKEKGLL